MKFNIINLGCKVNSYESDYIREKFVTKGFNEVDINETPDIVVINTCSVTNQSDAKSRHMIRLARKLSPNGIIVACGCSVQNHKDDLKELGANILLGNKDKSKILEYVEEFEKEKKYISKFYDMQNEEFEDMFMTSRSNKTRAFVKIQDGCDNYCAYCIIPYLRGNIRSKDIEEAYKEIKTLVEMGHKEIVLTGIHTGSYGRGKNYDLVDLIRKISTIDELSRIRISSIEITELDEKFIEEFKINKKICSHLHIPIQSGSDEILKHMNRKYDTKYFLDKINVLRNIRPELNITTDLIVGFPHETNEMFEETINTLLKAEFSKIHVFPFSLRSGTKAEEMKDYFVKDNVKKERVNKVLEISKKLEQKYYEKFIGKTLDIIVETSKKGKTIGHTENYIPIEIDAKIDEGKIITTKIKAVDGITVKGTVLNIE